VLLKFLERLGRKRIVYDRLDNEPYLERYYLFLKDRDRFPFNVFLHKFLKSDPDDLHDHPWPYFTVILRGGYYEWIPVFNGHGAKIHEYAVWRRAGSFRFAKANSYHRIELDPDVTCWTLFCPELNNVIGDSLLKTSGYNGNNICHKGKQHEMGQTKT